MSEGAEVMFAENDKITASIGNNTLNGYGGNDTLISGNGADFFQFTTPLNAGTNVDRIQNFKKSGTDKIRLSSGIFFRSAWPRGFRGGECCNHK